MALENKRKDVIVLDDSSSSEDDLEKFAKESVTPTRRTSRRHPRRNTRRHSRTGIIYTEHQEDDDDEEEDDLDDNRKMAAVITPGTTAATPSRPSTANKRQNKLAKRRILTEESSSSDTDSDYNGPVRGTGTRSGVASMPSKRNIFPEEESSSSDESEANNKQMKRRKTATRSTNQQESDSEFLQDTDDENEFDDMSASSTYEAPQEIFRPPRGGESSSAARNERKRNNFYCCPVCYVESYRRLDLQIRPTETVEDDDPVQDGQEEGEPLLRDLVTYDFEYDLIEVLKFIDPTLKLASAFCFPKISELKEHLRRDHAIHADSNALFHRFHSSQNDGLALRYLRKTNPSMKGLAYTWDYFKHVQEEIKMLHNQMNNTHQFRRQSQRNKTQEMECFEARLVTFWSSFTIRGHRIWDTLQQPFRRHDFDSCSEEDVSSDDDGPEGAEDAIEHNLLDRQQMSERWEDDLAEAEAYNKELHRRYNLQDDEEILVDSSESEQEDVLFGGNGELVDTDDEDNVDEAVKDMPHQDSSHLDHGDGKLVVSLDSDDSDSSNNSDNEPEEDDEEGPQPFRHRGSKRKLSAVVDEDDRDNSGGLIGDSDYELEEEDAGSSQPTLPRGNKRRQPEDANGGDNSSGYSENESEEEEDPHSQNCVIS